jgi:serine protease Do
MDVQQVVKRAAPSTVTLVTYDNSGQSTGQGSGFVLSDGRVVSNLHVVYGAAWVEIRNKDGHLLGTVAEADALSALTDLVVLPKLSNPPGGLELSDVEPEQGQPVVVIGSPQGLDNTVSDGIVSGRRVIEGEEVIQITAPISPGSSGGPVLDADGAVVGVAVAFFTDGQNLNFAVPARNVLALAGSPPANLPFPQQSSAAVPPNSTDPPGETAGTDFRELSPGRSYRGTLDSGDPVLDDGSHYHAWVFSGNAGDRVTIRMASAEVDAYLVMNCLDPDALKLGDLESLQEWRDDDGGGDTNAAITTTLDRTTRYLVGATTYTGGEVGAYEIRLDLAPGVGNGRQEPARSAAAQRWVTLTSYDGVLLEADRENIQTGQYPKAWVRWTWDEPTDSGRGAFDMSLTHQQVDCRARRLRTLTNLLYLNGELLDSSVALTGDDWYSVAPGSVGEIMIDGICRLVGSPPIR